MMKFHLSLEINGNSWRYFLCLCISSQVHSLPFSMRLRIFWISMISMRDTPTTTFEGSIVRGFLMRKHSQLANELLNGSEVSLFSIYSKIVGYHVQLFCGLWEFLLFLSRSCFFFVTLMNFMWKVFWDLLEVVRGVVNVNCA